MNRLVLVLALASLIATSCKEDRVCNCTVPANGSVAEQKFTYTMKDTKKKSARNSCKIAHEHYQLSGGNCELAK